MAKKLNYDETLEILINETRKAGGNALKIIEHNPPHWERMGLGGAYHNYHYIHALVLHILE